jgi:hypothetical protein
VRDLPLRLETEGGDSPVKAVMQVGTLGRRRAQSSREGAQCADVWEDVLLPSRTVALGQLPEAEFINFSFDVQFEGKNVPRAMDLMLRNDKNTPPVPVIQGPIIAIGEPPKLGRATTGGRSSASGRARSGGWCAIRR